MGQTAISASEDAVIIDVMRTKLINLIKVTSSLPLPSSEHTKGTVRIREKRYVLLGRINEWFRKITRIRFSHNFLQCQILGNRKGGWVKSESTVDRINGRASSSH